VPEENEFKKRNVQIAERLRTAAAPRIKEAAERRRYLLGQGWPRRACAGAIALQMEQSVRAVHYYLQKYDENPARYDAVSLPPLTWDNKKWTLPKGT
jgi:hypothetical protein